MIKVRLKVDRLRIKKNFNYNKYYNADGLVLMYEKEPTVKIVLKEALKIERNVDTCKATIDNYEEIMFGELDKPLAK